MRLCSLKPRWASCATAWLLCFPPGEPEIRENKALKAEGFPASRPASLLCGVQGGQAATHSTLGLGEPVRGGQPTRYSRTPFLVHRHGRDTRTRKNVPSQKQVQIILTFPCCEPAAAGLKQRQHEAVEAVRAPAAPGARARRSSRVRCALPPRPAPSHLSLV